MPKISAGILVHRKRSGRIEVLLVHPGGPFWVKRDLGCWSIPKGEAYPDEDLLHRARLELQEETGFTAEGPFTALLPAKQSAKLVYAWAAEWFDVATAREKIIPAQCTFLDQLEKLADRFGA